MDQRERLKRNFLKYIEWNENENTTYISNIWEHSQSSTKKEIYITKYIYLVSNQ